MRQANNQSESNSHSQKFFDSMWLRSESLEFKSAKSKFQQLVETRSQMEDKHEPGRIGFWVTNAT